jgi:anti-anti-sigma regulatory factor
MFIKIPKTVDLDTIKTAVNDFKDIFEYKDVFINDRITFDFSDVSFFRPSGLALIVALMKYAKYSGNFNEYFLREPANEDVRTYLERMDFYKHFNIEKQSGKLRRDSCSLCELKEVKDGNDGHNVTSQLINIICSQIHGIVCAQTYKNTNEVEIAIADCGIGIYESLKSNVMYSYLADDAEALRLCVGKRITSKPYSNAGEGLFVCKRIIKENMGIMDIVSGWARYQINNLEDEITNYPFWQGTVVRMIFNLNKPINMIEIFNSEFPEDAEFEDIFQ